MLFRFINNTLLYHLKIIYYLCNVIVIQFEYLEKSAKASHPYSINRIRFR